MRTLTLPLKGQYFDQIAGLIKEFEYRLVTPYWSNLLENREYDQIILTRGYPKKTDQSRRLIRPWRGFERKIITHEHFGRLPVEVYAITVN